MKFEKEYLKQRGTYSAFQFLMYCLGAFHSLNSDRDTDQHFQYFESL